MCVIQHVSEVLVRMFHMPKPAGVFRIQLNVKDKTFCKNS